MTCCQTWKWGNNDFDHVALSLTNVHCSIAKLPSLLHSASTGPFKKKSPPRKQQTQECQCFESRNHSTSKHLHPHRNTLPRLIPLRHSVNNWTIVWPPQENPWDFRCFVEACGFWSLGSALLNPPLGRLKELLCYWTYCHVLPRFISLFIVTRLELDILLMEEILHHLGCIKPCN